VKHTTPWTRVDRNVSGSVGVPTNSRGLSTPSGQIWRTAPATLPPSVTTWSTAMSCKSWALPGFRVVESTVMPSRLAKTALGLRDGLRCSFPHRGRTAPRPGEWAGQPPCSRQARRSFPPCRSPGAGRDLRALAQLAVGPTPRSLTGYQPACPRDPPQSLTPTAAEAPSGIRVRALSIWR
jgi:hypothetical protein